MTVLIQITRSARAVLWCALCCLLGMVIFVAGAMAQQAQQQQTPRVVILGKCSLDFDACFNVCQMTYPEGTASWQRGQYACGQQCVDTRSRCEGEAGLGQQVAPQTRMQPQPQPQQQAVVPPLQNLKPAQQIQKPVQEPVAPRPRAQTPRKIQPPAQRRAEQLVPQQKAPPTRRSAPIDPERRIPFSSNEQIAEGQQGSSGFDQSAEVRSKRADIREGFYVGAGGGLSLAENADNRKSTDTFVTDVDPKMTGFAITGVLGMKMYKNFRAEAEINYASNQLNQLNVITPGSSGLTAGLNNVDGDITALAMMANAYYDFPILDDFTPYVMGGAGFARIGLENVKAQSGAGATVIDDSAFVFAYQLGLGIGFPIGDDIAIDAGYRFFNTLDPNLKTKGGDKFDTSYLSHRFMLSARYLF